MTKIHCRCCNGTASVAGTHEYRKLPDCRNDTYIERGTGASVRIGGRRTDLIRVWDARKKAYVPLVE